MGNVIIIGGRSGNHMSRIPAGNVVGSDADAAFPASNLAGVYAARPWVPYRAATPPAADRNVTIDKNVVENSGGETADMTGWTQANVGAGNVCANVSTPVNSGARAFSLTIATTGGGNTALMSEDQPLRAGEPGTVAVSLRGDGTRTVRARVFIPETGQYVTAAGALQTTPVDFATRSAASYAPTTANFTAPAYSVQQPSGEWTLRLILYMDGAAAGTCFADDFVYWPHTDVVALIGHNVKPAITALEWRRDSAAFAGAGTLEATSAVYQPTLYNLPAAMRTERWWRLRAVGTNGPDPLTYRSILIGQKLILTQKPIYPVDEEWSQAMARASEYAQALRLEDTARRVRAYPWEYIAAASFQQGRDQLFRTGNFGEYPMLLIDDDTDPEAAMYCMLPEGWKNTQQMPNQRTADPVVFTELPFASFV